MSEIKIIEAPSIYLVGRQAVDGPELARFLADNGSPGWATDAPSAGEALVELAGRLCYQSFKKPRPGGNKAYVGHILEVGHGSVLEHEVFNLIITGVSRSLTHELVRHRAGFAYSQLSQRYVDESDVAFVVPPALIPAVNYSLTIPPDEPDVLPEFPGAAQCAGNYWIRSCEDALDTYKALVTYLESIGPAGDEHKTARRKAAREAARSVLPNCTETKIFVTGNARALRHFCELRGDAGADAEIRRLALALLEVLGAASPHVFGDYALNRVNGEHYIDTPYRKV